MYKALLATHSYLRWIMLLLLLAAFTRSLFGWLTDKPYRELDGKLALFTMISADLQLLLGAGLFFGVSPLTRGIFSSAGAPMSRMTRFWAVEHLTLALVAVAAIHVGRVLARKVEDGRDRHKRIALAFGVALAAIAMAIPWPFRETIGRALFFGM